MANFLITTPNSLYQGTDTQDLFDLRTGQGVSVVAAGGADTISGAATGFTAANIQGGAGNDTVNFAATASIFNNAAVLLGGGDDILSIATGAQAGVSTAARGVDITGGGGNDVITISDGATFGSGSSVNGNQGNDTINLLSAGTFTKSLIAGGGDNDVIQALTAIKLSGSTINGGGGNDVITLVGGNATISGSRIEGDTLNDSQFFGNDTITISATFAGSLVQGGLGNDLLVLSGTFGTGASVEGGAGTDSIFINAFTASGGTFVGGGADADTITVSAALVNNFGTIQGGGGNDSITVSAADANSGFIFGGAGADTINLGLIANTAVIDANASGVNVAYSTFTQSTLTSYDQVNASLTGGSIQTGAFMVSQNVVNFNVPVAAFNNVTVESNGFANFTGGFSNSLTARASLLDSNLGAGGSVFFTSTEGSFLFVQGGSAGGGTADDLIVKLGGDIAGGISSAGGGGALTRVSNSQLKVSFEI